MDSNLKISKIGFGANIAQNFINVAHNHYNYNIVSNRLKQVYKFNQKIEEYKDFGYKDYNIDYTKKLVKGYYKHYLIATNNIKNRSVVLTKQDTLAKIIERFLAIDKSQFHRIMLKG